MTRPASTFGGCKLECSAMVRTGRPTQDPKGERITVRLAPRDRQALQAIAEREHVTLAEAARRVMRGALGIPPLPDRATTKKTRRKS